MSTDGKTKNTGILSCLVILVLLVALILLGTFVYGGVLRSRDASKELRGTMSYLRNQIKNHDQYGCVELRDGGEILVLKEIDGEYIYEIRIYVYEGNLVEEYTLSDFPLNPEDAEKMASADSFRAEFISESMLRLTVDDNTGLSHLFAAGEDDEL